MNLFYLVKKHFFFSYNFTWKPERSRESFIHQFSLLLHVIAMARPGYIQEPGITSGLVGRDPSTSVIVCCRRTRISRAWVGSRGAEIWAPPIATSASASNASLPSVNPYMKHKKLSLNALCKVIHTQILFSSKEYLATTEPQRKFFSVSLLSTAECRHHCLLRQYGVRRRLHQ